VRGSELLLCPRALSSSVAPCSSPQRFFGVAAAASASCRLPVGINTLAEWLVMFVGLEPSFEIDVDQPVAY
jgi:hypothetical protein